MSKETDPRTGQSVPDTATTYERAKPAEESPGKALSNPPTDAPEQGDKLAQNAEPRSPKQEKNT